MSEARLGAFQKKKENKSFPRPGEVGERESVGFGGAVKGVWNGLGSTDIFIGPRCWLDAFSRRLATLRPCPAIAHQASASRRENCTFSRSRE
jgi:hypothetical protein